MKNNKKILVVFPTKDESKYFNLEGVEVGFCGVGLVASAYGTLKLIIEHKPDIVIMGGIAGVYKHSSLKIGDTVLVTKDRLSDLGFFRANGFRDFSKMSLDMDFDSNIDFECPYITDDMPFTKGVSNSMNCAMADFVDVEGVDVENMEGAAFFYTCLREKVEFYELRTISNVVELDDLEHENWDYETSITNLTNELVRLITYLKNETKA